MNASTSFTRALSRMPPLRVTHRTASKHVQIRQRLHECARGVAPETRLPTLRELSALFGATSPTVWRAVESLVAEGVLHTREKSGIFVGRCREGMDTPQATTGLNAAVRTLTLSTNAVLPHQKRFWNETLDDFHRGHRHIRLRVDDSAISRSGQAPVCDLMAEYLPRAGSPSVSESALLDLEPLMGSAPTRPFGTYVFPARARRFVPFQLTVPCLFINLEWAEKADLKRPGFTSFADQCAYIEACLERVSTRRKGSVTRINIQQPLLWLGQRALRIVDLARAADSPAATTAMERLVCDTETILRMWTEVDAAQKNHHSENRPEIEGFMKGQSMFYLGFSYEIEILEDGCPHFPWQVVPTLAVDDRTPVLMQCLAIDARTPCPVECVRFIEHVLSPTGQQRLADCSLVPLDPSRLLTSAAPARNAFGPEWRTLCERMSPIYPPDEDCDYAYRNIMADDLYRCVDGSLTARAAIGSMIRHTKAYFSHRESQQTQGG